MESGNHSQKNGASLKSHMSKTHNELSMKNYLAIILFVLMSSVAFAQGNYQEVVYLKNGSVIRGVIIEQIPDKSIKIETPDRSVFVYRMDEIEKLTKEPLQGKQHRTGSFLSPDSEEQEIQEVRYGIKGGLNMSNILMKDEEDSYGDETNWKPGFHIGLTAEFPIAENFAFETGLLLSSKGFSASESMTDYGETYKSKGCVNLLYLDLPLTVKTYMNVGQSRIFVAFGPYIGYGLTGRSKFEETYNGETESEEEDVNWGSDEEDDVQRLDFGLTAGLGLEIRSIQIGLSYQLGLANINADTSYGQKITHKVLGLSVAYPFGGR